jgi:signal transduction histidine kinase
VTVGRSYSSRVLIGVSCALAVLLAVLAVLQYRWATRVAEADAQSTKAHLASAAALFAREFDLQLAQIYGWLQNQAADAIPSHQAIRDQPRLIRDIYYLERKPGEAARLERLDRDGSLQDPGAAADLEILQKHFAKEQPVVCASELFEDVPAVVAPLPLKLPLPPDGPKLDVPNLDGPKLVMRDLDRCLVARLDENYLRTSLFPEMIQRYFGAGAVDAAVLRAGQAAPPIFGGLTSPPDVTQPFFTLKLESLIEHGPPQRRVTVREAVHARVFMRGVHSNISSNVAYAQKSRGGLPDVSRWSLAVVRKGGPIETAVATWKRQNLLLSAAIEVLLLAAIGFLLLSTRRMQKLAEQKMQFVAGVSHELRTPVSSIAMLSRNQADGLVSSPDQIRQYGALIHQQSQRLNEMVEQTLHFAGIQSGRRTPALREVSLQQVIEDVVAGRRADLDRAGFHIEVDVESGLPTVHGDVQWLEKAIDNLLSNAEKYARDQRWIRVSAHYAADAGEVLVTVEDHGIGIDAADFDHIFEPFCRGRRAIEAQIPGSGIGLSLVRSTAEAHRGSVTFVSEPNRGSSFTLHLPAAASLP